jgi:hypothetical protein
MDLERRRVRLAGWILRRHPPSPSPNSPETAPNANPNDGSDVDAWEEQIKSPSPMTIPNFPSGSGGEEDEQL